MPKFNTEVPHPFCKEDASERLKAFMDRIAKRYADRVSHLEGDWNDNVLNFALTTYGFKISGALTVEDKVVKLAGQLPFAAMAFRGKIEGGIAKELQRALSDEQEDTASEPDDSDEA